MPPRPNSALAPALALLLAACEAEPQAAADTAAPAAAPAAERPALGLMTSLPLYWPEGADIAALAQGDAPLPWQRRAIEARYAITPLDTLSPIAGLTPDAPETDPLKGLARLAVIQPRGLSPADNVALDNWVNAGGRLLMVLDPALTGEYEAPIGDPRRPVEAALIPPVVGRWGIEVGFGVHETEEAYYGSDTLPGGEVVPLAYPGHITLSSDAERRCVQHGAASVTCRVGQGQVTLIADAALFEHSELAGEGGAGLGAVIAAAFETPAGENAGSGGLGVAPNPENRGKTRAVTGF